MRTPLVSIAAVVALLACGDPVAPVSGRTFALKTVGSSPLPVVGWHGDTFTAMLVGDTLRFNADGTGSEVVVYRFEAGGPLEDQGQIDRYHIEWTQTGSTIQFVAGCAPEMLCISAPAYTGSIGADGSLTVTDPYLYN
jgi:hypothetical protein